MKYLFIPFQNPNFIHKKRARILMAIAIIDLKTGHHPPDDFYRAPPPDRAGPGSSPISRMLLGHGSSEIARRRRIFFWGGFHQNRNFLGGFPLYHFFARRFQNLTYFWDFHRYCPDGPPSSNPHTHFYSFLLDFSKIYANGYHWDSGFFVRSGTYRAPTPPIIFSGHLPPGTPPSPGFRSMIILITRLLS